jgi:hypothetical protein
MSVSGDLVRLAELIARLRAFVDGSLSNVITYNNQAFGKMLDSDPNQIFLSIGDNVTISFPLDKAPETSFDPLVGNALVRSSYLDTRLAGIVHTTPTSIGRYVGSFENTALQTGSVAVGTPAIGVGTPLIVSETTTDFPELTVFVSGAAEISSLISDGKTPAPRFHIDNTAGAQDITVVFSTSGHFSMLVAGNTLGTHNHGVEMRFYRSVTSPSTGYVLLDTTAQANLLALPSTSTVYSGGGSATFVDTVAAGSEAWYITGMRNAMTIGAGGDSMTYSTSAWNPITGQRARQDINIMAIRHE